MDNNNIVKAIFCNSDIVRKYGPCGINGKYFRESLDNLNVNNSKNISINK